MASPLYDPTSDPDETDAYLREVLKGNPHLETVAPIPKPSEFGRPLKGDLTVPLPKTPAVPKPSEFGRPLEEGEGGEEGPTFAQDPIGWLGVPKPPPVVGEAVNTAARAITRGTVQPVGDILKNFARDPAGGMVAMEKFSPIGGLQTLAHKAGIKTPTEYVADFLQPEKPIEPIYKAGEAITDFAESPDLAAPKGWEGGLTDQAFQALGTTNMFLATSLLGRGAVPVGAILGTYLSAEESVNRAIQAGATPEQIKEASRMGSLGGATEPLPFEAPVETILNRIPAGQWKPALSVIGKILTKMAAEGGQEALQQGWSNFTAQYVYKPDQDLTEGLLQAFGLGALVGGVYGGIGEIGSRAAAAGGPAPPPPPPPPLEGEIIPPDAPGRPGARTDRGAPIIDLAAEGPAPPAAPLGLPGPPVIDPTTEPPVRAALPSPERQQTTDFEAALTELAGPQAAQPQPVTFTTSKGSTYAVNPDGTTTRNKAFRPEHGEKEQGPQPQSEATFYVTLDDAIKLGEIQAEGASPRRIANAAGNKWAVQYLEGPSAGKYERRTVVEGQKDPAVGLIPVELWNGGTKVHFGNEITGIQGLPDVGPATTQAIRTSPRPTTVEPPQPMPGPEPAVLPPIPQADPRQQAIQEARQAIAGVPAVVPSPPAPDEDRLAQEALDAEIMAAIEESRHRPPTDPIEAQIAAELGAPIQLADQVAPEPPAPGTTRLYRDEPTGDAGWSRREMQAAPGRWSENPREARDWYHQDRGGITESQQVFIDVPTEQAEQFRARSQPPRIQRFSRNPGTEFFLPPEIVLNRRPIPSVPQAPTAPPAAPVAPAEVVGGARPPLPSQFGRPLSEVASRGRPLRVETAGDTALAEMNVAVPTEGQQGPGNYRKGHLRWPIPGTRRSFSVSVEVATGGTRRGQDPNAPWEVQMPVAYGYLKGTKGGEGKQFDVFVGPNPASSTVFVVDQINPDTGKYDEGKGLIGFNSYEEALQAYEASFSDGRGLDRIGAVSAVPIAEFETWVRSEKATKPFNRKDVREARKQRVAAAKERAAAPPPPVEPTPVAAPQAPPERPLTPDEFEARLEERISPKAPPTTTSTDAAWWDSLPIEDRNDYLNAAGVQRSPKLSWKTLGETNQQKILAAIEGEEPSAGLREEQRDVTQDTGAVQRGRGREDRARAIQAARREGAAAGGVSSTGVDRLPGLPANAPGGLARIVEASKRYLASVGIPYRRQSRYAKANPALGQRIADAYGAMAHAPKDPKVKAAYKAMIEETLAQYQFIKALGIKIDIIPPGEDPYPEGPVGALLDLRDNNHWWLFPTQSGFGTEASASQVQDNPLLGFSGERLGVHRLTHNDVFRIVHDIFGHAREGVRFAASGEENAWQSHVRMYSPLAAMAMTAETRGQNSWVNFGPFGDHNRTKPRETVFAPQKNGMLPDWVLTEGVVPDAEAVRSDQGQVREERDELRRGAGEGREDLQRQAPGQPSHREPPRAQPKEPEEEVAPKGLEESYRRLSSGLLVPEGELAKGKVRPVKGRIPTRFPHGAEREADPWEDTTLTIGGEHVIDTKNIDRVRGYLGMAFAKAMPALELGKAYLDWQVDNILYIYDHIAPHIRDQSRLWYEGAHKLSYVWSESYKLPQQTVAAVMAVLSPQKDWFQNASLAQRILDIYTKHADEIWSDDMTKVWGTIDALAKHKDLVEAIKGKKLSELRHITERALWLRIYDETYLPRGFRTMHPNGQMGDFAKKGDLDEDEGGIIIAGNENELADIGWGGLDTIEKAIMAIDSGGDMKALSRIMGFNHKVRSFFNNINVPKDHVFKDVTADTHAGAGAHLQPFSGTSAEVSHILGGSGLDVPSQFKLSLPDINAPEHAEERAVRVYKERYGDTSWKTIKGWWKAAKDAKAEGRRPDTRYDRWKKSWKSAWDATGKTYQGPAGSSVTGAHGSYGIVRDAYAIAAGRRNVLPREMQSITWEGIRALFSPAQKRNPVFVEDMRKIWRQVDAGKLTPAEARGLIFERAGIKEGERIAEPVWARRGFRLHDPKTTSTYEGDVRGPKLLRERTGIYRGPRGREDLGAAAGRDAATGLEEKTRSVNPPTGKLLEGHVHLGSWEYDDALPMGGQAQDYVREQGKDKKVEFLLAIDANGQVLGHGHGDKGSTGLTQELSRALDQPSNRIALHHNHPSGLSLSTADIAVVGLPGAQAVWAYGHNGNVYRAAATEAYRKWVMPFGKGKWDEQTKRIADNVDDDVFNKLQELADAHKVDHVEATSFLNHLRNIVLHNAGIIDYDSNVDASAFIAKAGLQSYLDSLSDKYAKAVFNGPRRRAGLYGPHRPTVPLRHAGEVGSSFEKDSGLARQRLAEAKHDRGRPKADRGKARPKGWWRALGLSEEQRELADNTVDPFGDNPRLPVQPVFYSTTVRAVERAKITKAPPDQWMNYLRGQPDVKKDELSWLGVEEWLAGQKSVTKQDLTDFVRANQLTVTETVRSDRESEDLSYEREIVAAIESGEHLPTVYGDRSDLNIPGGTNPGELLIRLSTPAPTLTIGPMKSRSIRGGDLWAQIDQRIEEAHWKIGDRDTGRLTYYHQTHDSKGNPLGPKWVVNAGSITDAVYGSREEAEARIRTLIERIQTREQYHTSHWEEGNIVAWARFDEREIDGKRVLFIQEVQSDWHQKGRDLGYKPRQGQEGPKLRSIDIVRKELDLALEGHDRLGFNTLLEARAAILSHRRDFADRWEMTPEAEALAHEFIAVKDRADLVDQRVPDAPFKSTWHELTMKRAIRWAADNGFDAVAWTTGQMQIERYNLSKVVEEIHASRSGEDTFMVVALPKGSKQLVDVGPDNIKTAQLAQYVGRDLAKKIAQQGEGNVVYAGLDLETGGQFHRDLYDTKLPSIANRLGKKFGAQVGKTNIEAEKEPRYRAVRDWNAEDEVEWVVHDDVTGRTVTTRAAGPLTQWEAEQEALVFNAAEDQLYRVVKINNNLWEVRNSRTGVAVERWPTFGEARKHEHELNAAEKQRSKQQLVPSLPITDAMREGAQQGFGLFQATRTVRPPGFPPTPNQRRSFMSRLWGQTPFQSFRKDLLSGSALYDLIHRLPYEIFGGADKFGAWNAGKYLHAKSAKILTDAKFNDNGKFTWLNPLFHNVRQGLGNRYQLDEIYKQRTRGAEVEEEKHLRKAMDFADLLKSAHVGATEAKVLHAILTGERTTDAQWQALSEPIREAIVQLGQEMVQAGLITEEEFRRHKGKYLHRIYQKYEFDRGVVGRFMGRMSSSYRRGMIGDELKHRGKKRIVSLDRLFKDIANKTIPQKGDLFRVLRRPTGNPSFPFSYLYLRSTGAAATPPNGYEDLGDWEVRGVKKGDIILGRDWTKAERTAMGEIVDARYLMLKTFMLAAHDLASGKLYTDIASNPDWTSATKPANAPSMDAAEYKRYWNDATIEWVKVPDSTIAKSDNKRWGALAGKYVRAPIWRDLAEINRMQQLSFWSGLVRQWKMNKTVRSLTTHAYNVMGNVMLMDLAGIRSRDVIRALVSLRKKDDLYKRAVANGAFGKDYTTQELQQNYLDPLLQEIKEDTGAGISASARLWNKILARLWSPGSIYGASLGFKAGALAGAMTGVVGIPAGAAIGAAAGFGVGIAANKPITWADQKMMNGYRKEDMIFRMATFIRRAGQGATDEEASLEAQEQFLNYDIHAPWINFLRRGPIPFAGFSYALIPVMAKSILYRPWKLHKYYTLGAIMGWLALSGLLGDDDDEEDEERERRSMPEREQGWSRVGPVPVVPTMVRTPWRSSYGNPIYYETSRNVVGGDLLELGRTLPGIPQVLQPSGPLLLGGELAFNRNMFTDQDIRNDETGTLWDNTMAMADHAWKGWMPNSPWTPGSWAWDKLVDAYVRKKETYGTGKPISPTIATLNVFGIRAREVDPDLNFEFYRIQFGQAEDELGNAKKRLDKNLERNIISKFEYDRALKTIESQLEDIDVERKRVLTNPATGKLEQDKFERPKKKRTPKKKKPPVPGPQSSLPPGTQEFTSTHAPLPHYGPSGAARDPGRYLTDPRYKPGFYPEQAKPLGKDYFGPQFEESFDEREWAKKDRKERPDIYPPTEIKYDRIGSNGSARLPRPRPRQNGEVATLEPKPESPIGPAALEEVSPPEGHGWLYRMLIDDPPEEKYYPTPEEGREAIRTGQFYGETVEPFTAKDVSKVLGTKTAEAGMELFNTGSTKLESGPPTPALANIFGQAGIAVRKSGVATVGFDPRKVVTDMSGEKFNIAGFYIPSKDVIWFDPDYSSTVIHESTHRGMKLLEEKYPSLKTALGNVDDEMVVRRIMQKNFGKAEEGRGGNVADAMIHVAEQEAATLDPIIAKYERAAQREIAREGKRRR